MSAFTRKEDDAMLGGLAKLWQHLYGFLDGVAIRCALELGIPDIINSHDGPITLSEIANGINSPSPNINGLSRLMRFLVQRQIIDQVHGPRYEEPVYSLNHCSKWLLRDFKINSVPFAMMMTDSFLLSPFYNIDKSIVEGGTIMEKTFGSDLWGFLSQNEHANRIFNEGIACKTRITMDAIMSNYRFDDLEGTLVDVAGGLGAAINEIVNKYPQIKGVNYDLPQVVSSAPAYEGVTHVGGDMFKAIPPADSIFLKSMLHNWSDDECVQILKNCRDSMRKGNGKIIIVDIVLHLNGDDVFDDVHIAHDLLMFSSFESGKERSEAEWKKILEEAGFHRYKIIKIPAVESIIEAYAD